MKMVAVTDEHGVQKVVPRPHPTVNVFCKEINSPYVHRKIVTIHRVSDWIRINFEDGPYIMLRTEEFFQAMGLIFSE